jgi:hypothetical protein
MTPDQTPGPLVRSFLVRPSDGAAGARTVQAEGFEAAALIYAETQHAEADELRIIVRDAETGRTECFRYDVHGSELGGC